ncbi:MBL fold metallo-hydrolase [Nodosilinea sp. FACHB-131]|uniref:MBL fold metallo-hydrolase n=1 Tax=Cyanophyceae TaxID=3028117 RepID=UPI00168264AF|nr:MBL fold metallo-hydrolase [Nodosilinea sp. FACHB-131]MBD1876073.1 MBL fold metallo-hydrolase [Nodosilinea sp. FACHB-131]
MTAASAPVSSSSPKAPRPVFDTVYAFAPNRDTQGATAYFIVNNTAEGRPANLLIDAPAWDEENRAWLAAQGGVQQLFITHRGSLGRAVAIQKALGCEVVIQEQEAYLLPDTHTTTFHHSFEFSPELEAFWTPGHSPGSACLYYRAYGGVLFTGRHLLPSRTGEPEPLRLSKTFHWPRQLKHVEALKTRFSRETLAHICPGASTGFLRGQRTIDRAYERLQAIDIETYRGVQPLL